MATNEELKNREITCPHCGAHFQMDGSQYAVIAAQVRTREFTAEVDARVQLQMSAVAQSLEDKHRAEIAAVRSAVQAEFAQKEWAYNDRINHLQSEAQNFDSKMQAERLAAELRGKNQLEEQRVKYEKEIQDLKFALEKYKEMKMKLSTKAVGEELERFCSDQFNSIRATAYPRAYFDKDNEVIRGSKGDFIFRDYDEDGLEYVSIMFEMKTQMDTTEKKHKHADFFDKLNTDRCNKHCEYAVMVSMLEEDSDLYNQGIVDCSWKYPKMYVVRPQYFLLITALIRNVAQGSLTAKRELANIKRAQVDLDTFNLTVAAAKKSVDEAMRLGEQNNDEALDFIDKAIANLTALKEKLRIGKNHIETARKRIEGITVDRMAVNSPGLLADLNDYGTAE